MAQQSSQITIENLVYCFQQSLDLSADARRKAEAFLKQASECPNYGLTVLTILNTPNISEEIRLAAAVNFKNHIKHHWDPSAYEDMGPLAPMQDYEKEQVKQSLLDLMLNSSPSICSQISEALTIVSKYDFPRKWPKLLPNITSRLSSSDYNTINAMLHTANAIFKRFRHQYFSDDLKQDLKYCLDNFSAPMLSLFKSTADRIGTESNNLNSLKQLFTCQRLLARIFYSLNSFVLPEFFEDHMAEWMAQFHAFLNYNNPLFEQQTSDEETELDQFKAAICQNIDLYIEKSEEEFEKYLPTFVTDVWTLLSGRFGSPKHDHMVVTGLQFLTTVSKSRYSHLFSLNDALNSMCLHIIIPNIEFREDYEELFMDNPADYIRRDMEGSDSDTRRRMASELVKELSRNFFDPMSQILFPRINQLLSDYSQNPKQNWKAKDSAIFLVIALAVRQKSATGGATATHEAVNLSEFFTSHILPELKVEDKDELPVIKADALKFVTVFRNQLSKQACMEVLSQLSGLIGSENSVVHSYAANCLDRILMTKQDGRFRLDASDLTPFTAQLFTALFSSLNNPESQNNPYIMKCIMRVASMSDTAPLSLQGVEALSSILSSVCQNPTSSVFNHYLFETMAVFMQKGPSGQDHTSAYEAKLFPILEIVLREDIVEFMPYMFQILALLVERRGSPLPDVYMQAFAPFVSPQLWSKPANAPALVRLLQSYLEVGGSQIASANQLDGILGVFNKLVSMKHSDQDGFILLNAIVSHFPLPSFQNYLRGILITIFSRLQTSKTPKFMKCMVMFMSCFIQKHGVSSLEVTVEGIQPGLFLTLIDGVWIHSLPLIMAPNEHKLAVVASMLLLTTSPSIQASNVLWGKLLESTISLLEKRKGELSGKEKREEKKVAAAIAMEEEEDEVEMAASSTYGASYAKLHHAAKKEVDVVKDVTDVRHYVISSLGNLCISSSGRFSNHIQTFLSPANKDTISGLCVEYKVNLV